MEDRLLFIIGSPRSGSTLLARMLGAHTEIHAPAEPHLLTPLAHIGVYGRVDAAPYDPIITEEAMRALLTDLPGGEDTYLVALRRYTDAIYEALLEPTDCRFLLDKTPAYALVLDFAARLYPRSRYVVLTRNPLAIWCSYVESFFDGDFEVAHAHNPVLERYVPAIARFLRESSVPIHHVRYEDLVQDPELHLRRIAEFGGFDFQPGMVDYGEAGPQATGRGLGDPVTVAREKRPTTSSLARWTQDLAGRPEAVANCARILDGLADPDLETWGFRRSDLEAELASIAPEAGPAARRPRSRHSLERKFLVALRRNIHHNGFGRLVKRIRHACDVLLR